jgi:hypothetical protein
VCGGICIGNGGACTTSADCCPGLPCTIPPGSTRGICGTPPPPGDGGRPDASFPPDGTPPPDDATPPPPDDATPPPPDDATPPPPDDATPPPDGGPPPCAEYGQVCTTNGDCCNGVPCTNGRCVYIIK